MNVCSCQYHCHRLALRQLLEGRRVEVKLLSRDSVEVVVSGEAARVWLEWPMPVRLPIQTMQWIMDADERQYDRSRW